jgi:outer membrane protein assembly complex protein YaeT
VFIALLWPTAARTAERSEAVATPAEIEVDGLGWWRDRQQERSLNRLLGTERGPTLEVNAIEDAVFLLLSSLTEQGYLEPVVEVEVQGVDGRVTQFIFDASLESSLPRSLVATRLRLDVERGVRFVFDEVRFTGLQALEEDVARQFFMGEPVLISRKASRVFSPALLRRAVNTLEGELQRLGYAEARVTADAVQMNHENGEVDVTIEVTQGPRWLVTAVRTEGADEMNGAISSLQDFTGQAWSQLWQQNVTTEIRNHFYARGFPDATVRLSPDAGEARAGVKAVAVIARVNTGPAVTVGHARIEGAEKTHESVLRRRIDSEPGQPLDPLAMEQARFRLARLGIFDAVELRYEPPTGPVRDPVFTVREGREMETNLLFGYGSYEQLRGGIEWRRWNLWGRAHQSRLLLLQSFKSSRGEYSYTVPELFGESLDGTARLFGLQRQETSFLRQEFGATFAVSTPVKFLGANARLGYTFQSLQNKENTLETQSEDVRQVNAASIDLNLVRDRRDNPLRPRRGYRWYLQGESASRFLGGSVDYQRTEFGGSYHTPWGGGRWVHVGLNHGVVTTFGSDDTDLPVNRRFFPGGDNSIRGYQEGEAAPLGAEGKFVGAKSYLLLNVELEQALTTKWSAILFFDALGSAARLADYPFNEQLYSVGLGVRYQTIIGPLRVEYGRNLDPRPLDPSGSLLFSVGFPF